VWLAGPRDEPVDWYDELDADRWSTRCVRKYRDGSLRAYSYANPCWRECMPEKPIPPVEEIDADAEFSTREITKAEFDAVWERAIRAPRA